jgi:PAS domain S-box-containing protein
MLITKSILKSLVAGMVILLIFALAGYLEYSKTIEDQKEELKKQAENSLDKLENALTSRMINLESLLTYSIIHGGFSQDEFEQFASALFDPDARIVRGVTYLTGTTITHIYPLAGSEKALGLNIALIEEQAEEVLYVKNHLVTILDGPISLVQGGRAFICRSPAVLDGQYIGQFSILFNFERLLEYMYITRMSEENYVELSIIVPGNSKASGIYSNLEITSPDFIEFNRIILDNTVSISIYPKSGFRGFSLQLYFIIIAALVLAGIVFSLVLNNERFKNSLTQVNLGLEHSLEQLKAGEVQLRDRYDEIKKVEESLRKSEEFRKRVFESSRLPIVIMDAETQTFLDCNPAGYQIHGCNRMEEFIGKNPLDFSASVQYSGIRSDILVSEYIQQAIERGSVVFEWQNKRPDGTLWDAEIHLQYFTLEGRQMIQFSSTDITERKLMEKEREQKALLEKKVLVAEESLKFKQNFLANMSHEIRTPLTGVIGMIEILEQTPLNEHQKDYLSTLKNSSENLKGIINQVLDFSKIEAGKVKLNESVFYFPSLVSDSLNLYKKNIHPGVELTYDADSNIPDYVIADYNRLSQVLNNLISNALKFTHEGNVVIESVLWEKPGSDDQMAIKILVCDTGIGIAADQQNKLFLPFSQIDANDVRPFEGTGLGLSICRQLVELMRGDIGVESEQGKGSTFWFTFPCRVAKESTVGEEEGKRNYRGKLRILIAEDKPINQKVLKLILTSMNHEVEIANNGQQALMLYEPGKFDLILMDIQMPLMDGVTATRLLKKKYDTLPPIVGLSANAFEGDREKYMAIGMDEYLTKPVKQEDFVRLINLLFC